MRETVWQLVARACPDGVPYRKLGEVCEFPTERISMSNAKCYVGVENLVKDRGGANVSYDFPKADTAIAFKSGDVLIGNIRPYLRKIWLADSEGGTNGDVILIRVASESLNARYLYYNLSSESFFYFLNNGARGGKMPRGDKKSVPTYPIPVPPPEVQREVVRILDEFTTLLSLLGEELAARRKQYAYYRDCLLSFDARGGSGGMRLPPAIARMVSQLCPDGVPYRKLGEVCVSLRTGLNPRRFFRLNTEDAQNYYVTIREIKNHRIVFSDKTDRINDDALKLCNNRSNLEAGDVLFSGTGTIGNVAVIEETPTNWNIKEGVYVIKPTKAIVPKFLMYLFESSNIRDSYMSQIEGGTVKSISMAKMNNLPIPIPPHQVQREVVRILDEYSTLTESLTSGLPAEIAARQKQYEYYRDKLLSFKRKS